ncbi:cell division protein FtsZ [Thalassotalea ganghwensis]
MNELIQSRPKLLITVIGVGGCGCNTLNMLSQANLSESVNLVAVNTDIAALNHCNTKNKILIGEKLTNGYGAGADPEIGLKAAQESEETLRNVIEGSDVIIITAGFGGGTGTGAVPFIASLIRDLNIPSIAVVTLPFESESKMRMNYAIQGILELREPIKAYITLSNDLLLQSLDASVGLFSAFTHSNEILRNLIVSLASMLTQTGIINVDINDFSRILSFEGESVLGVGKAQAEDDIYLALEQAINNPIVQLVGISKAKGVIIQVCCKNEISITTYNGILDKINNQLETNMGLVIAGVTHCPEMADEIEILIVASGISTSIEENKSMNTSPTNYTDDLAFTDSEINLPTPNYIDVPTIIRWQEKINQLNAAREELPNNS